MITELVKELLYPISLQHEVDKNKTIKIFENLQKEIKNVKFKAYKIDSDLSDLKNNLGV